MERIVAIGKAAGGFLSSGGSVMTRPPLWRVGGGCGSVVSLKQDLLLLRFGQGRTGFVATRVSLRALRISGGSGLQRLRKILNDWPQALRVSLWRGTLWRGSQEPRQTRLKEAGTERRGSALRSLSLPSRRFRRADDGRRQRPD